MITEKQMKSMVWVNNHTIKKSNLNKEKPCLKLGWCPYGQLVEAFDLRTENDEKISCKVFGHDCPMFYQAEDVTEERE